MIPDPTNYEMKRNKPAPQMAVTSEVVAIDTSDKEKLKKLCMDELAALLVKHKGNLSVLPVIREIMDREWGKPGQQVTVDANVNVVTVNANVSFIKPAVESLTHENGSKITIIDNQ